MGTRNLELNTAKANKQDEFYTCYEDIKEELKNYDLTGKVVYCNCDNPNISNFCRFFVCNFNQLQIKRLICTAYNPLSFAGRELTFFDLDMEGSENEFGYLLDISTSDVDESNTEAEISNFISSHTTSLKSNGDFRSLECIEYLKVSDIVITNPPFSLFRQHIAQIMKYEKKFLIIGNVNAITYADLFPLIMENKVWLGASIHSGDRKFYVPEDYPLDASGCGIDEQGKRFIRVKGVRWFTNMDYAQRYEDLKLEKSYSPEYKKYSNYDAINVDKVSDIPNDYTGIIGVPITFLDKFNPNQFEIVGMLDQNFTEDGATRGKVDGECLYARILIRKRQ